MIIDCHTHLGRNHHIMAGPEALIRSMDEAGIDKSLVFAGKLNDSDNDWMMDQIRPFKDRLFGVASIHLAGVTDHYNCTNFDYGSFIIGNMLDTLNAGAVALKLYTGYEHYAPNSERVRSILNLIEGYNKPVIFHTGDCLSSCHNAKLKYAQPLDVDDIAVDYPDINFVIAHIGFPWHRDTAEVCFKNKNVFADISGFVYGNFSDDDANKFKIVLKEFLDICPGEKLLMGTDFPISNQKSYIDTLRTKIGMGLTPEFLSDNALKVFNIK